MKRDRGTTKEMGGGKRGAGVTPKGVFARIAKSDLKSGVLDIVRHTQPQNLKQK